MKEMVKNSRVEVVDALRGFAVMAILLVHNLEHFIFPVYPVESAEWLSVLDQGVFNVVFSLFAGKAYAIFAMLFGFTFLFNRIIKGCVAGTLVIGSCGVLFCYWFLLLLMLHFFLREMCCCCLRWLVLCCFLRVIGAIRHC